MSGATFFLSSSSSTRLISFPNLFSSHLLSQLLTSSSYLFCLLSSSLPLLFPSSSFSLLLLPPLPHSLSHHKPGRRALSWTQSLCKESWDRGKGAPFVPPISYPAPPCPEEGDPKGYPSPYVAH